MSVEFVVVPQEHSRSRKGRSKGLGYDPNKQKRKGVYRCVLLATIKNG